MSRGNSIVNFVAPITLLYQNIAPPILSAGNILLRFIFAAQWAANRAATLLTILLHPQGVRA
jgi:hypothetical protein